MELLFDIGNSALKWGWLEADRSFHYGGRLDWPIQADLVLHQIEAVLPGLSDARCWVANVGPRPALYPLLKALETRFGCYRMVFSEPACCGVRNGYEDFSLLGVDRWLALIGARRHYRADNLMVVDAGSALTVDLLKKGQHQGGMIVPGVQLMRRCLTQNTGQLASALARSSSGQAMQGLGRTTQAAIEGGTFYMSAAFLQMLHVDLQSQLGQQPLQVVMTGGQAEPLAKLLMLPKLALEPHLVLQGLAEVVKQSHANP